MTAERTHKLLYTEDEAAAMLGLSERFLRQQRHTGDLPFIQCGSNIRYSEENLRAYIERNQRCISKSINAKAHRSINTPSHAGVVGLDEVRARRAAKKRRS